MLPWPFKQAMSAAPVNKVGRCNMSFIKWIDDHIEEVALVVLLIFMTIVMSIQVIARYVFSYSLTWSEEITRYMFIWSGFLSISFCYKKGIVIKIEQVLSLLPNPVRKIISIFEKLVALVFFIYMVPFGYKFLLASIDSGQLSPAMRLPMHLIQSAPIVGFILTAARVAEGLIKELTVKTD